MIGIWNIKVVRKTTVYFHKYISMTYDLAY
jgi:hypothetical protein